MNIEQEIFKKSKVDFKKLINYGFTKKGQTYHYSCNFLENRFRADMTIDKEGKIVGKVIDLEFNEEYLNLRIPSQNGEFVIKVREQYRMILKEIKKNCFLTEAFLSDQTQRIVNYVSMKYKNSVEHLWEKYEGYGVLRNQENQKWYAIIMNVDKSKLGLEGEGEVEIINLKLEPMKIENLCKKKGFYPAYHMNHKSWISVLLDDTLQDDEIIALLDESYEIVSQKKGKA